MQNLLKNNYILVLSIMLICARQSCLAQNWQIVGGGVSGQVDEINIDTTTNSLFISGAFRYADTLNCYGISNWDGNVFTKLSAPNNYCNSTCFGTGSVIRYNNRLFMSGDFGPYNNREEYLFEYINNNWQPSCTMGATGGGLWNIKVINNQLFAFGIFDSLCNKNTQCLAIFNGTDWEGFNLPSPIKYVPQSMGPNYWIKTGEYYKGQYYFGGNFHDGNFKEVIRWDGTQWLPLQSGILGGMADVTNMKVFKNNLYVSGLFYKSDGNVADCLMAWDGQNWFNPFPEIQYIDAIRDMEIINNELYISGNYIIPNDNDSNMYVLGRFNGCKFGAFGGVCKYPEFEYSPWTIGGYKNRIYVAARDSFFHQEAKYLISISDTVHDLRTIQFSPCLNSVKEIDEYYYIKTYPNPVVSVLNIVDEQSKFKNATIQIKNYLGQTVYKAPFSNQIDISNLSAGMYFLTIEDKSNKQTVKIIKQ